MASGSWSRNPEDLTDEPLLHASPKFDLEGAERPSVGKYVLLSKLGQGGMGVVYHATHKQLGNEVALKLRPRGGQRSEEEMLARFMREAQIAAQLRSSHLVSVLDIDEDLPSHCDFIVMEYVNGPSGTQWLDGTAGRASEAEALDVCIAATRGLETAHLQGIVHRDIKPSNILIPFDHHGRPQPKLAKLCDLGLARPEATDENITRTQVMMGTPGYMAPEQAASARRAGKSADVLSMGATLFKLLTGRAPFIDPETDEWLLWTVNGKHVDPAELRPDLTPATLAVLDTCLRLDPAERFPDASALLVALEMARSAIGCDVDAETLVDSVESLIARGEQGLPARSRSDAVDEDATLPTLPSGGGSAHDSSFLDATTIASSADRPAGPTPRSSRTPVYAALVAITVVVAVFAWSPWSATEPEVRDARTAAATLPGLYVTSKPSGAMVEVDGVERGRAPLLVTDLADGSHAVRVSLQDYEPWSTVEARTARDQRTPLHGELIRAVGALHVRGGAPGAQVTLTRRGDPPHSRALELDPMGSAELSDVEAGLYGVRATAPGHEPVGGETRVTRATPTRLVLPMPAIPGKLSVTSSPEGATCSVDGTALGRTPLESVGIAAGHHELVFELPGYGTRTIEVDVAPEQQRSLDAVTLQPWGTLSFDDIDDDVRVAVREGRTLSDGDGLPAEPTTLVLSKPRHAAQEQTVSIPLGGRLELRQQPWSEFIARLDLSGLPADVKAFVDDEERSGLIEYDRAIRVTVRLERPGSKPQDLPTELQLGDTRRLEFSDWELLPSHVDLSGLGGDVAVEIDGRSASNGQQLGPGDHRVRLVKRGRFEPQVFTLTAQPGETLRIERQGEFESWITWPAAAELLADAAKWDRAIGRDRRHAAEFVAERMDRFTLDRLEEFEGGGVRHEIAVFTHASTGLEFSLVPGGTFRMGSTVSEAPSRTEERPVHEVRVAPLLVARTECTQAAWEAGGGRLGGQAFPGAGLPLDTVAWATAKDWCGRTGLSLPSEAQWEYACRAGTKTVYWAGNAEADLADAGWYQTNSGERTHPPGDRPANAFGLHDVHGNVFELCEDTWSDDYREAPEDGTSRVDVAAGERVIRGGSFDLPALGARAAYRRKIEADEPYIGLGFRPVRAVPTN